MSLTPQQLTTLRALVQAEPTLATARQTGDDSAICAWLNEVTTTAVKPRTIVARNVLGELGLAGATMLEKIENFGLVPRIGDDLEPLRIATKWGMRMLQGDGLDIGNATTRGLLAGLAQAGIITADERDAALAMALQPATRAEAALPNWSGMVSSDDASSMR